MNFPKQKQAFLIALAVFGICKNNPLRIAKSFNSLVECSLVIFQIGFVFNAIPDEFKLPSVRASVGMEDISHGETNNNKSLTILRGRVFAASKPRAGVTGCTNVSQSPRVPRTALSTGARMPYPSRPNAIRARGLARGKPANEVIVKMEDKKEEAEPKTRHRPPRVAVCGTGRFA